MRAYLRLAGGLGNQLYQMAALALCADRRDLDPAIVINGLSRYAVARDPDVLRLLSPEWQDRVCTDRWAALWVDRCRAGRWCPWVGIGDRKFWSHYQARTCANSVVLDGYFQVGWTEDTFFRACRLLGLVSGQSVDTARDEQECVVHIRGGDFLRVQRHQVVDHRYYARAIGVALQHGFRRFVVATDDVTYASKLMNTVETGIPGLCWRCRPTAADMLSDFFYIKSASARIIGNSTFAWWAAALDGRRALTWSPVCFTRGTPRDFFLTWERVVS